MSLPRLRIELLGAPRLVAEKLSSIRSFDSQFGIFDCFDGYFSKFKTQKRRITLKTKFQKIREMKKDAKQLLINGFLNQVYQIKMNAGKNITKYRFLLTFRQVAPSFISVLNSY